jgi:hypothetical protein
MSIVDLYSIEKKFGQKRDQYLSLMKSIKYSCLGKEKTSSECLKAAKLNAEMQSHLIQMSNLIVKYPIDKNINKKQLTLLRISDNLEKELQELVSNDGINSDVEIKKNMYDSQAFLYGFVSIIITGFVIYQYKKI